MREIILVGGGGFVGAILRYVTSGFVHRMVPLAVFPYGTMVVNVVGCLVLGFLNGLAASRGVISDQTRLFLMIGVLGSFTTFSTFGAETMSLFEQSDRVGAVLNVVGSVVAGLLAVWVGQSISRLF